MGTDAPWEPARNSTTWTPTQRWLLVVLLVSVPWVAFFNLGRARTLNPHEGYLAVTAEEMLQSGDWLVPRFGGVPRLTKPPCGYWVVAALGRLLGEIDELVARLPSALAGVLLLVLIRCWADRWFGRSAGLWAALVQLTSIHHLT